MFKITFIKRQPGTHHNGTYVSGTGREQSERSLLWRGEHEAKGLQAEGTAGWVATQEGLPGRAGVVFELAESRRQHSGGGIWS